MDTLKISRDDDVELATCRWPAPTTPEAALLIVHGMAEHAQRYAAFAQQLNNAALEVWAFDLRGHGATTAAIDHGFLGTGTRWQTLVDDVEAVRSHLANTVAGVPIVLFGHSLGSLIAQASMQTHGRHYAGVILSGPANPSRIMARLGALVAAMEAARVDATGRSAIMRKMTFGAYEKALKKRIGSQRTHFDWLSSQPAPVDAYIADPQTGFDMRAATWQHLLTGMARTQAPHARRRAPADLPLLIAAGSDDPAGGFGKGPRALANSYLNNGQTDVSLRLYDGARHELINDNCAANFTRDILYWLAEHSLIKPISNQTGSPSSCCDN